MARLYFENSNKSDIADYIFSELVGTIERAQPYKVKPNYKPSSIDCVRKMYYIMKSMPIDKDKEDYQFIGICESGTDRHKRIQDAFKVSENIDFLSVKDYVEKSNIDYLKVSSFNEYETHLFDNRYKLSFMCDGLIKVKGKVYILEIKTESNQKFYSHSEPYFKHIEQATCYSISLGIDDIIFIYENRDLLTKSVYYYKIKASDKKLILNRIKRCEDALSGNYIPPKPKEAIGKFCQYCDYKRFCK